MEFEKGDYLINIEKLKAKFYDEFRELSIDGTVNCEIEAVLVQQIRALEIIEKYGQKME